MNLFTIFAVVGYLLHAVNAGLVPPGGFTRLDSFRKRDVATTLGSKLSPNATIMFPNDPDWSNVTARWTQYLAPSFSVVVEPATEADIVEAVCYIHFYSGRWVPP